MVSNASSVEDDILLNYWIATITTLINTAAHPQLRASQRLLCGLDQSCRSGLSLKTE